MNIEINKAGCLILEYPVSNTVANPAKKPLFSDENLQMMADDMHKLEMVFDDMVDYAVCGKKYYEKICSHIDGRHLPLPAHFFWTGLRFYYGEFVHPEVCEFYNTKDQLIYADILNEKA